MNKEKRNNLVSQEAFCHGIMKAPRFMFLLSHIKKKLYETEIGTDVTDQM